MRSFVNDAGAPLQMSFCCEPAHFDSEGGHTPNGCLWNDQTIGPGAVLFFEDALNAAHVAETIAAARQELL